MTSSLLPSSIPVADRRPQAIRLMPMLAVALMLGVAPGRAQETSVKPGINKSFEKPNIGEWVQKFELESREIYHFRERITEACGLKPGMAVADIGAGTGIFTRLFAKRVGPTGKVFAVDIAKEFVDHCVESAKREGMTNVVGVACKGDDTLLPADSVEVAFICDTYHHFEFPAKTLGSLHRAMKSGGRVVLIDFKRVGGKSSPWVMEHVRAGQEVFEKEIADAGFRKVREESFLAENYLVVFERVDREPPQPAAKPVEIKPTDPYAGWFASTPPLEPAEQLKRFKVPPGFRVELVAAEPTVRKPINMSFDTAGRLYVSQSTDYPIPAPEGGKPADLVTAFDDVNRDGVYDRHQVVARGLRIPNGVAAVHDGLIAYSIPQIEKFPNAGPGVKEGDRKTLYRAFGYVDTHGMSSNYHWWIDGWVYACHGFANHSKVVGADGHVVEMHSGSTYRFRPDGSRIEVFTRGQVNPFGLCFDSMGNLFSADCHTKPAYQLLRGAWYPMFGAVHDGLGLGPEMIEHLHGSTGIAGIVRIETDRWPDEFRGNLLIGNPITGRINRDRLEPQGSTLLARELPDFLSCDDPWFRPVDLRLAPDGSIYVADFYNRVLAHVEVPLDHPGRDRERGRIWRIVPPGPAGDNGVSPKDGAVARAWPAPRDLRQLPIDELIGELANRTLTARVLATHEMVHRIGPSAIEPLRMALRDHAAPAERKAHGLWALERLGGLDDATALALLSDGSPLVRVHAVKALGQRGDWGGNCWLFGQLLRGATADLDPFVRRAAAQALGDHPHWNNLRALMQLLKATPAADTHLIHATRISLRDNLREKGLLARFGAELNGDSDALAKLDGIALGLRNEESSAWLEARLKSGALPVERAAEWFDHVARHAPPARLREIAELARRQTPRGEHWHKCGLEIVARVIRERSLPSIPELRADALALSREYLGKPDRVSRIRLIELTREFRFPELANDFARLVDDRSKPEPERIELMDLVAQVDRELASRLGGRALADSGQTEGVRNKAAEMLAGTNTPESRKALVEALAIAPDGFAAQLARHLAVSRDGSETLLASISAGKASARLLTDWTVAFRIRSHRQPELIATLDRLSKDLPKEDARLEGIITARRKSFSGKPGRAEAGKAVFTKHCALCHKVGTEGAKIGPELDGLGVRGPDRIIEDMLNPSRNVDQAFRATLLSLEDGRVVTGLVLREEGDVIVLADAQGKEQRFPKKDVVERKLSPLSPMPADFAEKIPERDFADLVAWLASQKVKPAGK